jgi:hypothetical protein
MKVARQALKVANIEAGHGTAGEKERVAAWDRLDGLLSTLDSKTSALLRFNAIVVAALAYLVIVQSADPFAGARPFVKTVGFVIGHVSLLASVVSCGFAFPVIKIEWEFFGGRLGRPGDDELAFDNAAVERLGELVERRTWLYAWAWRLAVAGGAGFALLVGFATIH